MRRFVKRSRSIICNSADCPSERTDVVFVLERNDIRRSKMNPEPGLESVSDMHLQCVRDQCERKDERRKAEFDGCLWHSGILGRAAILRNDSATAVNDGTSASGTVVMAAGQNDANGSVLERARKRCE